MRPIIVRGVRFELEKSHPWGCIRTLPEGNWSGNVVWFGYDSIREIRENIAVNGYPGYLEPKEGMVL